MTRVAWAVVLVGLAGCGSKPVPVYPVSGQVKVNGKPPAGWVALLHLEPPPPTGEGHPHPLPRALVGPDGRFKFRTYGAADGSPDGAPAGTYRISFVDAGQVNRTGPPDDEKEKKKKSPQVYWPEPIVVRPEANELPPFELTR